MVVGHVSGSTPLERESRAQARAAADSLICLPGGSEDAALPASTRNCRRSAGLAGTAMLADRQSPVNVDGAIAGREYGDQVEQATGAIVPRRGRWRRSDGSGRGDRRRRRRHRKRFGSGGRLGSLVQECWRQRGVSRISWFVWSSECAGDFTSLHDPSTAGTPTSKRIGAGRAGRCVTGQMYPLKICEPTSEVGGSLDGH